MKKYLKIIFIFLPLISFGQLTSEEKATIDNYANYICPCINKVINSLDPLVVKYVNIMANEGEEKAMKQIEEYVKTHTEEDAQNLVAGFDEMSSVTFQNKISSCDNKKDLTSEMSFSIDNAKGEYNDYFYNYLATTLECKMTNYLMLLGTQVEENEE